MRALDLITLGAALARDGLVRGAGGNLSYRAGERLLITARGAPLAALQATDIVGLHSTGQPLAADGPPPSSEWALHVAAYRARPTARVVVHAHPPKAIALGLVGHALPALTPDQYLYLGARVPLVPYLTPTTGALAEAVGEAMRDAPAVLLQNHGVVVAAVTIEQALRRLHLLEASCAIFLDVLAVGVPQPLDADEQAALDAVTGGRYRLEPAPP